MVASLNGIVVKPTIPSRAYLNNFQKDHFVSPAALSTFSYSRYYVSKPTHAKMPFEKRLTSLNDKTALTILEVIIR